METGAIAHLLVVAVRTRQEDTRMAKGCVEEGGEAVVEEVEVLTEAEGLMVSVLYYVVYSKI